MSTRSVYIIHLDDARCTLGLIVPRGKDLYTCVFDRFGRNVTSLSLLPLPLYTLSTFMRTARRNRSPLSVIDLTGLFMCHVKIGNEVFVVLHLFYERLLERLQGFVDCISTLPAFCQNIPMKPAVF